MDKVSVLISGRNDPYLTRTVEDVFTKATGAVEVVAVLDGPTEHPLPKPRKNLLVRAFDQSGGIRTANNRAAEAATGKYIMRLDSHCAVGQGFDEILKSACADDWIVSPRMYDLCEYNWDRRAGPTDYFYPAFPWTAKIPYRSQTWFWYSRMRERGDIPLDEQMLSHGSAWLMAKRHWERLGGMDESRGTQYADHFGICWDTWAMGGKCMVEKRAWYAHRHPAKPKGHVTEKDRITTDIIAETKYWTGERRDDYERMVDHFWPLPTETHHHPLEFGLWPEDWKRYL